MTAATRPRLTPGRVYRTRDFAKWSKNAPRLAKRLVEEGALTQLAQGLFARLKESRFGPVPPSDEAVMAAFLNGSRFLFTGTDRWNALGLGATGVAATPLVYNTKRTGEFKLGNRTYRLRRVPFPTNPPAEWFAVDLIANHKEAGVALEVIERALSRKLQADELDREVLTKMATRYGTKRTQALVARAIEAAK